MSNIAAKKVLYTHFYYFVFYICLFLGFSRGLPARAQTKAHELSKKFIIDPAYTSVSAPRQTKPSGPAWIYGYAEYESWRLQVMQKESQDAKLLVAYPGEYHNAYPSAVFSTKNIGNKAVKEIRFYSNAAAVVKADGVVIYQSDAKSAEHVISFDKIRTIKNLSFNLNTALEPPCLLIKQGPFSTFGESWSWQAGNEPVQRAVAFSPLADGSYPHQQQPKELTVNPVSSQNDLFDFGRELIGYVYIKSEQLPRISVGESVAEAADTLNKVLEQSLEIISVKQGLWRSKAPLAFRYVQMRSKRPHTLSCGALFYPAAYEGAFACSDTLLNRIWMNSAYTLRLCRNDFLMDGVKRDRLPWAGDLAMSMMVNAFTFAEPQPVRQSLVALNRAGISNKDVNGIIDYSLWWIISQDQYQLYYKDAEHLKREWQRIKETLNILDSRCDELGFLNPKDTWLFIDWVNFSKNSALQMLWWWAQESAVKLADRVGDKATADKWRTKAGQLKVLIKNKLWSNENKAWMDDPYEPKTVSRHANILSVVSGLASPDQYPGITAVLKGKTSIAVGTPYMGGFETLALDRMGDNAGLVDYVTDYWGGMLSHPGTTTFWEGYNPAETGSKAYAFYDRPYAKSLCHAWSSGPAAMLPASLLGIRPLSDGWKTFSIAPSLGKLSWISATVPTPYGPIIVDIEGKKMSLVVPKGTIAVWNGKRFTGPQKVVATID